jgi:hypothetical protein
MFNAALLSNGFMHCMYMTALTTPVSRYGNDGGNFRNCSPFLFQNAVAFHHTASRLFTMSRVVSLACCRRRHHTPNDGSRPVPVLYPMQMERGVVLVPDKVTLCFGRL